MAEATFLETNELVLNMGPQHPSTHGVLRVILRLDGERVLGTECIIGYLHRGVEKIAENRTYKQFAPYVDRMDYVAAVSNNLGYIETVEKLLGASAPPRARYIRTLMAELNRISSHLLWLATHALDIGAMSVFLYCFREREKILDFFEDAGSGEKSLSAGTAPRLARIVADLERKEGDPARRERIRALVASLSKASAR